MKILTLALWLISSCVFAQNKESYHVINILGATTYSTPDFDAQIIGRIDFGKILYFEKVLDKTSKKRVSTELELEGNWIKIILHSSYGYIFSSDLSIKPTELIIDHNDLQTVNLLGKELEREKTTEEVTGEFGTFPLVKIKTKFERAILNEEISDGCHSWKYTLEGFTLSEAYHQLINLTSGKYTNQIEIPATISRKGNVWNFSNLDAIQELKLHDLGDGKFKITLYSCT
ncbi:MAG: hypothetical protein ACI8YP_000140 [Algoriphagus sp.]|jgi:hypothetical protein